MNEQVIFVRKYYLNSGTITERTGLRTVFPHVTESGK